MTRSVDPVTTLTHFVSRTQDQLLSPGCKLNPGELISGKYRLMRQLGAGGMGSVWAARNEFTDHDFAIKFLLPSLARNKEALDRFFLEARACGQIRHPAIVDVYDMGQAEDGSPYLVMELLEGEGLDARIARVGRFDPIEAARNVAFVARGLEEAHLRGLVHRDLKPGNIFFARDERGDVFPKVLDFGISKASANSAITRVSFVRTTPGAILGSPAYMSPEQAKGDGDVDARSDVWSLGVILYEAITGAPPFDAPNYNALMVAITSQAHVPAREIVPALPAELSSIIDRALSKDRSQRINTAIELAELLEAFVLRHGHPALLDSIGRPLLVGQHSSIPPTSTNSWGPPPAVTPPKRSVVVATLALTGVAVVFASVFFGRDTRASAATPQVAALGGIVKQLKPRIDAFRKEVQKAEAPKGVEIPFAALAAEERRPVPTNRNQGDKAESAKRVATKNPASDPHGGVENPGF